MKSREEALEYALSFEDTYKDAPFHDPNWQLVRYRGNSKAFLWSYERNGHININLKCDPEKAYYWRQIYRSVQPGYHQNKDHWNTVVLDGSVPDEDIRMMIAESYDLIADSPTRRIYEAVKMIPRGRVATYGTVAMLAGDRKMARAVGNALHKNKDPENIPCYRVVNASGKLADAFVFGGINHQERMLKEDGIEVIDSHVDLSKYGWNGPGPEV
ncbi:MAG: methylated-DNA--[protein]-cysteine S-methyltransferase [Lachnospiraceae bacterium]|nr:methylated-DNA--[protein]-cysteine S-methyltransferase [Lachnospiraceae bacterium]